MRSANLAATSEALKHISADDRDVWVRMGMAIKAEFGEEGFDVWNAWSRTSEKYREAGTHATWRSIQPEGGVTIATLMYEAKRNGYRGGLSQGEAYREPIELVGSDSNGTPPPPKREDEAHAIPILPIPDGIPPVEKFQHPRYGKPSRAWPYRDREGCLLGYQARFDFTGEDGQPDKDVLPILWTLKEGKKPWWRCVGFPEPLPLYNADLLAKRPDDQVLVCEGCKAADAAGELFPRSVTTTWPSGAGSVLRADWSALRGRIVVLWPDADPEGLEAMARLEGALAGRVNSLHFIKPPEGVTKGWDAADALSEGWDAARIQQRLRKPIEWTPPRNGAEPKEGRIDLVPSAPKPMEQSRVAGQLTFTSLRDLLSEPEEKIPWLVEDHLPAGGLGLVAGKPKAGKTTLVRCLALSVARGTPWLGFKVAQGSVLYLALEEKRSEVRKHFAAMGASPDDPIFVYAAPSPENGLEQLRKATEEKRPALIILDPLFRFIRVRDGNDYVTVTAALEPLMSLARDTGAHVLAVHHLGKGEREGGDAILGSTAIFGAVDSAFMLKRTERHRTLSSIQRYGKDLEEITLDMDPDTREVSAGPTRKVADEAEAAILAWLRGQADSVTEPDIHDAVEGRKAVMARALRRLVDEGRITRSGQGKKGNPYFYGKLVPRVPSIGMESGNEKPEMPENPPKYREISGSRELHSPGLFPESQEPESHAQAASVMGEVDGRFHPFSEDQLPREMRGGREADLWETDL